MKLHRKRVLYEQYRHQLRNRRHKLPLGECSYCDREREQGNDFHPSHDASVYCESGKHSHCACDTCF